MASLSGSVFGVFKNNKIKENLAVGSGLCAPPQNNNIVRNTALMPLFLMYLYKFETMIAYLATTHAARVAHWEPQCVLLLLLLGIVAACYCYPGIVALTTFRFHHLKNCLMVSKSFITVMTLHITTAEVWYGTMSSALFSALYYQSHIVELVGPCGWLMLICLLWLTGKLGVKTTNCRCVIVDGLSLWTLSPLSHKPIAMSRAQNFRYCRYRGRYHRRIIPAHQVCSKVTLLPTI